ncbi:MAG: 1-acyl-sn-glycerol-3-phosphate acyltransferase, partial [Lachnospiraceae bacterium]|nr:1-acyl-sn-glycerol-3-phosphate acyltransferase [Lachnospiraceae bacterium]
LNTYSFVVAQDQDYLNVLCKGNILWVSPCWNIQMIGEAPCKEEDFGIVHYNLAAKPWHYKDCKYGDKFWTYAAQVDSYREIRDILNNFSESDKEKDDAAGSNLLNLAISETANEKRYANVFIPKDNKTLSRIEIKHKIEELEKAGIFDKDVENDPPAPPLLPDDIEYVKKTMREKLRTAYAFKIAHWFVDFLEYKKQFVVKDVLGIENIRKLNTGAIITCNHFNAFDSFAIQKVYDESGHKKRKFYRIIREGNYTGFPGFFGFLMRNCNTLPLSSNMDTMKKFMDGVNRLLKAGHFILIYPEQSMWWNYRKPKPLKKGGFTFAAGNNVPVLPVFVTMKDTDVMDENDFPVQEYTIHVCEPIWPDKNRSKAENVKYMMEKNYEVWKKVYEDTYGIPLTYTCDQKED